MLLALAVGVVSLVPPAPPANPGVEAFHVDNAHAYIEQIAIEPRPMGSAGNRRGRDKIVSALRALGIEPEIQAFTARNYYSRAGELVELANVLARIPGTDSSTAIALMGHHDTFPTTHGANDDTSALAIMLEVARAVLAGPPLRNDLILIFTDGEEPAPRYGATAFADEHPWFAEIGFVVNLEAIGTGGPSIIVGKSGPGQWLIREYARAVPYPVAFSFITEIVDLIGGSNTDFSTFKAAGVPGFDIAYMTGSPIYHTMADLPDRVGKRSLYQQGANTLALAQHLGNLGAAPPRAGSEAVFFNLGGLGVIRYPESWALPIAVMGGLILLVAAWRQQGGWLRMLRGFGVTFGATLLAMAVSAGIWILLAGWRSTMGVVESYAYLAGFTLLTLAIGWGTARLTKRGIGTGSDAVGVATLWWALGLLLAIGAPGAGYLLAWPALIAGIALMVRLPQTGFFGWRLCRWIAVSLTTLAVLVPAIDFFYQFAQPRPGNPGSQVLAAIVVPILLISLAMEMLRAFYPRCEA